MVYPDRSETFWVTAGRRWVFQLKNLELRVRMVDIDPKEKEHLDDRFTLYGGKSAGARTYEQTLTVKDDATPGDDCLDLVFTKLIPDLSYWLEVDPGQQGAPYHVFENLAWEQIKPG